jgi:subtilisin family serine protease
MQTLVRLFAVAIYLTLASFALAAEKPGAQKKQLAPAATPHFALKSPQDSKYLPDRVIVKLNSTAGASQDPGGAGVADLADFVQRTYAGSIERMFPHHVSALAKGGNDLSKYYVLRYSTPVDAFKVAQELSRLPGVEYAEPWFIYPVSEVAFTPNDPDFSKQWAFARVQADSAWEISQGDTSVVIGIVDTGVQWDHPDLAGNIWINPGESGLDGSSNDKRTNGVDDDGNGYVDDWHGWDFMGADYANPVPDNNTSPQGPNGPNLAHGSHVSGIAAASTNNATGVAGIGFKCRILAVKASADNDNRGPGPYIIEGFSGIVYAADMGAQIINLSWGGSGGSQFEQDMINYATARGALVVAAAGNFNSPEPHYPAWYDNVLAVAATDTTNGKAYYSNYGIGVDVTAPGGDGNTPQDGIYSTWYPNTYATISGTSMSSPIVAGICGLVKSHFPSYSNLQVSEQVRVTCTGNFPPEFTFGKGRVNAYKALSVSSPAIRMTSMVIKDSAGGNNNGSLEPNETFTIGANFVNYLQPTGSGAVVTLSVLDAPSPYVSITGNTFPIGAVGTNGSANNYSAPFQVHINSNVPQGRIMQFVFRITDGSYSDWQIFELLLNPTFGTMNVNNVQVTITNNGRIGFNDAFTNTQGVGFVYGGGNHLFEAGLLVGYSSTKIVNVVRDSLGGQQADFSSPQIFNLQTPGTYSAQEGSAVFTDNASPTANKIGLEVSEFSYAFNSVPDSDYVIVRYDIKNSTASALSNVYAGLFFDWDMLPNFDSNKTAFDASRSLGYAWDNSVTAPVPIYCGARALNGAAGYRGLLNSGSLPLGRTAKWAWLNGGVVPMSSIGDIHFVISSGPYSIPSGQKKLVAFALLGGRTLSHLQANADAAESKWNSILPLLDVREGGRGVPESYALLQNYPNPFNPLTVIRYSLPVNSIVSLRIYNLLGQEVATLVDGRREAGWYNATWNGEQFPSGVYFYRLTAADVSAGSNVRMIETRKLMIVK